MEPTFTLKAKVWRWKGKAAWHFLTIPKGLSAQIKSFETIRKGFGSVPINVTIGESKWKTSIFPTKEGTYVLPLKAKIRKAENISEGDTIDIEFKFQ